MERSSRQLAKQRAGLALGVLSILSVIMCPKVSSWQDVPHLTSLLRTHPSLPAEDDCRLETLRLIRDSYLGVELCGGLGLQSVLSLPFLFFALQIPE